MCCRRGRGAGGLARGLGSTGEFLEKYPSWATSPPLLPPAVLARLCSSQASASRPPSTSEPSSRSSSGHTPRLEEERSRSLDCRVERSLSCRDVSESQSSMSEVEEQEESAGEAPGGRGQAMAGDAAKVEPELGDTTVEADDGEIETKADGPVGDGADADTSAEAGVEEVDAPAGEDAALLVAEVGVTGRRRWRAGELS